MAYSNAHITVADDDAIVVTKRGIRTGVIVRVGGELTLAMTPAQARHLATEITNYLVANNPITLGAVAAASTQDGAA